MHRWFQLDSVDTADREPESCFELVSMALVDTAMIPGGSSALCASSSLQIGDKIEATGNCPIMEPG